MPVSDQHFPYSPENANIGRGAEDTIYTVEEDVAVSHGCMISLLDDINPVKDKPSFPLSASDMRDSEGVRTKREGLARIAKVVLRAIL
jgi:hypothetical protein